jgi:hypothetical protein
MRPAAIALDIPRRFRLIFLKNKNGSAPRPVAMAVIKAAIPTVQELIESIWDA